MPWNMYRRGCSTALAKSTCKLGRSPSPNELIALRSRADTYTFAHLCLHEWRVRVNYQRSIDHCYSDHRVSKIMTSDNTSSRTDIPIRLRPIAMSNLPHTSHLVFHSHPQNQSFQRLCPSSVQHRNISTSSQDPFIHQALSCQVHGHLRPLHHQRPFTTSALAIVARFCNNDNCVEGCGIGVDVNNPGRLTQFNRRSVLFEGDNADAVSIVDWCVAGGDV